MIPQSLRPFLSPKNDPGRPQNGRLTEAAIDFTTAHRAGPFFVYFAFGHVHTATPNVDPDSNPYSGKQYAECDSYGATRRGLFGDALSEVDRAVDALVGVDGVRGRSFGFHCPFPSGSAAFLIDA
jgi:hypothetical protein